jgi:hypothetical protein
MDAGEGFFYKLNSKRRAENETGAKIFISSKLYSGSIGLSL